ncbi:MAG TPA: Maf family nucleotide pyrophosphatase [Mycobacterium sp.]|nr:Maf family nucleotide pyrophosphatase [Mycobacterium sp.]
MTRVVLASASSGRRRVLRQAGVDPVVVVSGVDEDAVMAATGPNASPAEVTTALATAKADAVLGCLDVDVSANCIVIGCDSMLLLDGKLSGKPGSAARAREQWHAMAGRSAELVTGHALIVLRDGAVVHRDGRAASTVVHFGRPAETDLSAYIDGGEPLWVAGGFTLDGLGGWFVERIEGDPSNVIGISLPLMTAMLAGAGLCVGELWQTNPVPADGG